jgi:hypothetical protein
MSSVDQTDEGLASGINNAASRIAQLDAVALAAGVASFASGYEVGLIVAAPTSIGGAFTASITLTPAAAKAGGSGGVRKLGSHPDRVRGFGSQHLRSSAGKSTTIWTACSLWACCR